MTDETLPDTPAVLIDLSKAEANLMRAQAYADAQGFTLRPHIKTHKLPRFAKAALEMGATGITCQKIGEAEVMADAGIGDILITYNIVGARKLARLKALAERVKLAVVADGPEVVDGYAAAFADAVKPLTVFVECDTGAGRCGVQDAEAALALARRIDGAAGLRFGGLMTYPPQGGPERPESWLSEAVRVLTEAGIEPPVVTSGGSPDLYKGPHAAVTEYRPGTYIYSDRMQVGMGLGSLEDCALIVLATVVSRPTARRAILDTGSKALAADTCAAPGYGHIVEYPGAVITQLNEEHGIVDLGRESVEPKVGDVVHVIPNHVCVVSNLFDEVWLTREGAAPERVPVAARGKLG